MPAFLLLLLACGEPQRVVVAYTSVDQVFSAPVFQAFEAATQVRVQAVYDTEETKSTGVTNRLIAEASAPQADVYWANDPVRPFLLVKRDLVEPYVSPEAAAIPPAFRSANGVWTGVAARARMMLVNRDLVPEADTPTGLRELAEPRWKGRVAIANPLYGTTTMHVAALFTSWGEAAGKAWMDALRANDVRIAASNGEVERLVTAGEAAVGILDTDDAAAGVASGAHVVSVVPDQDGEGTLVMPSSVVLIRGGPHPDTARLLVDWLLSAETERRMADNGGHMPLRADVTPPAGVLSVHGLRAMPVDYAAVAAEMEKQQGWLRAWAGL